MSQRKPQERKDRSPAARANSLEAERLKMRRGFKKVTKKAGKQRAAGEKDFKMQMGVILDIAGYTAYQISLSLGESKSTIVRWKKEPEWDKLYEKSAKVITGSALTLLQTYTIEAVQTLATLMRTGRDDKVVLDAVKEILDRGGMPKASRQEVVTPSDPDAEKEARNERSLMDKFRALPPEAQQQAADLYSAMEEGLERIIGEFQAKDSTKDAEVTETKD